MFFDALGARDLSSKILGFELDDTEAKKAKERAASAGLSDVSIRASDFLGWALKAMDDKSERFDAVIGNPPDPRHVLNRDNIPNFIEMIVSCYAL